MPLSKEGSGVTRASPNNHYGMQECTIMLLSTCYKTTNRMYNDIHD